MIDLFTWKTNAYSYYHIHLLHHHHSYHHYHHHYYRYQYLPNLLPPHLLFTSFHHMIIPYPYPTAYRLPLNWSNIRSERIGGVQCNYYCCCCRKLLSHVWAVVYLSAISRDHHNGCSVVLPYSSLSYPTLRYYSTLFPSLPLLSPLHMKIIRTRMKI